MRDLSAGGSKILFPTPFILGQEALPINGLVWMGDKDTLRARLREQVESGAACVKMKIGAIGIQHELETWAAGWHLFRWQILQPDVPTGYTHTCRTGNSKHYRIYQRSVPAGVVQCRQQKNCGHRDHSHPLKNTQGTWLKLQSILRVERIAQKHHTDKKAAVIQGTFIPEKLCHLLPHQTHATFTAINLLRHLIPDVVRKGFSRRDNLPFCELFARDHQYR